MNKIEAIIFGAGSIGRGFLGELLFNSGYNITFVDVFPGIVQKLLEKKGYPLRIVGPERKEETFISNVSAILASEKEKAVDAVSHVNLVFTAVGVHGLHDVAGIIAAAICKRKDAGCINPINIIVCENLPNGTSILREWIEASLNAEEKKYSREHLGLVGTVVSRMVPVKDERWKDEDPMLVLAEDYSVLPVDKNGFVGESPQIKGMVLYPNMLEYQERKLFTHNLGHALCAYFGWQKGYSYIYETVEDSDIKTHTLGALNETAEALIEKHGFSRDDYERYIQDLMRRFANRMLGDTIERVGRDPLRKLGKDERLIGGARLCLGYNIKPHILVDGICAAIGYNNPIDAEAVRLSSILKERGIRGVLREVSDVSDEDELCRMIITAFDNKRMLKHGGET